MNKKTLLTTKGNFTPKEKESLLQQGIKVIECKDPGKCVFVDDAQLVPGSELLNAALQSISNLGGETVRRDFVERMATIVSNQVKAQKSDS